MASNYYDPFALFATISDFENARKKLSEGKIPSLREDNISNQLLLIARWLDGQHKSAKANTSKEKNDSDNDNHYKEMGPLSRYVYEYKNSFLLMICYTLDYLSKRNSYLSYRSCLQDSAAKSKLKLTSKAKPEPSLREEINVPGSVGPEHFYKMLSAEDSQEDSAKVLDKNATNKISAYCQLNLYPIGKYDGMDTPHESSYFINEFQYPVALQMIESRIPTNTFDRLKRNLRTTEPKAKRKAVNEFLKSLYRVYFEVIEHSIEKYYCMDNIINFFKIEYGLGVHSLHAYIKYMSNRLTNRPTDPPITKSELLASQYCPLLFEKYSYADNLIGFFHSEPQSVMELAYSYYSQQIYLARLFLVILYNYWCHPGTSKCECQEKFDPKIIMDKIKDYFELNAPITSQSIPILIRYMYRNTPTELLKKCSQSEMCQVLDNTISTLPNSVITILSEFLLERFEKSWWDKVDRLLCKAPLELPKDTPLFIYLHPDS